MRGDTGSSIRTRESRGQYWTARTLKQASLSLLRLKNSPVLLIAGEEDANTVKVRKRINERAMDFMYIACHIAMSTRPSWSERHRVRKRVGAVTGWPKGVGGIKAVVLMASEYFGTASLHSAPHSSSPGDWYLTTATPAFLILPHLDARETETGVSSFGSSTSWTTN